MAADCAGKWRAGQIIFPCKSLAAPHFGFAPTAAKVYFTRVSPMV